MKTLILPLILSTLIAGLAQAVGLGVDVCAFPNCTSSGGGTPDDNSVTSAKIVNGTIVSADISNSAAITDAQVSDTLTCSVLDAVGAAAITIGSADVTSITLTTDGSGTGEVVLPLQSVTGAEITNDSITATQIDETGAFAFTTLNGKTKRNTAAIDDDSCTGEQGTYWYDTTDSAFEFCNADSGVPTVLGGGGGTNAFSDLTSSTNTTAAMVVSTGASLGPAGTGTITANAVDAVGAAAITIGSVDVTSVTVTTDSTGTAEVALPAGSIDSTEILNGTVALADMADLAQDLFIGRTTASTGVPQTATITAAARSVLDDTTVAAMLTTMGGLATADALTESDVWLTGTASSWTAGAVTATDGTFLNLSAINASSTTEGLRVPQNTSCSAATAEGEVCWDTDGDALYMGNGSTTTQIGGAAAGVEDTAFGTGWNGDTANAPSQNAVYDMLSVRQMYWGASSMSADGTQCANPAEATLNSGPKTYTVICTDNDASTIYGHTVMPDGWDGGTVTFELEYLQSAADTNVLNSDVAAMCRGAGETINNTWGTEIAIDDAAVSGSNIVDHTTSAAVTANGTCAAGDTLFWRIQLDATGTTTAVATLHLMGVKATYTVVTHD